MTSPVQAAAGSVAGRLLDEEHRPLAGMQVRIVCDEVESLLVTGGDGRYARSAGAADRCTVEARDPIGDRIARDDRTNAPPEKGSWGSVADVNPRGSAVDVGDRQMFLPVEVQGRIVDARTGAGIAETFVSVQDQAGGRDGAFTRSDGRFGPVRLWPGRYYAVVDVEQADGLETTVSLLTTDPGAFGRLIAPGDVWDLGTVRVDRSAPPSGRIVVAGTQHWYRQPTPSPLRALDRIETLSGPPYRYRPGTYLLQYDNGLWHGGRSALSARPVTVSAGRTTTVPAPLTARRGGPTARDAAGRGAAGVFVAAYRADDPVEVVTTAVTDHNGNAQLEGIPEGVKVLLTWTDLWGRYTTRVRVPYGDIDLGTSRNGLPADPRPYGSDPLTTGPLRVPAMNRDGRQAPTFGFQVFDVDDPSRPVQVAASHETIAVPPGSYRIRMIDPTGRWATTYLGGATRFAGAKVFRPWTAFPRDLEPARLRPAFAPLVPPRVSGTPAVGRTLSTDRGRWNGGPTSYAYRWYRSGKAISGATRSTYRVTKADVGRALTVRVTARRSGTPSRAASSVPVTGRR
jgi:hypothetical protein